MMNMKLRLWQIPFVIALLTHFLIFTALGYALRDSFKEEIHYIEVTMNEVFAERPGSRPPEGVPVEASPDNAAVKSVQKPVKAQTRENAAVPQPQYAENVSGMPVMALRGSAGETGTGKAGNEAGEGDGGSGGGTGDGYGGRSLRQGLRLISGGDPPYPAEARANGWQGKVTVRLLVSAAGRVQDVHIAASSGYNCLDQAALREARRWHFNPASDEAGRTVAAWATRTIRFDLTNVK